MDIPKSLQPNPRIYFQDEFHRYFVDSEEYSSVSRVIKQARLSDTPYPPITAFTREVVLDRGTAIHEECEKDVNAFMASNPRSFPQKDISESHQKFRDFFGSALQNVTVFYQEQVVFCEPLKFAGRFDFLFQNPGESTYTICDFKSGGDSGHLYHRMQVALYAIAMADVDITQAIIYYYDNGEPKFITQNEIAELKAEVFQLRQAQLVQRKYNSNIK